MKDGISDPSYGKSLVGGFYDAGDAIKFNFPASFAMTMLSWSVIEYSAKYDAAGELGHVKEIIKWGVDYLLRTFNSSADTIDRIATQVGQGATSGGANPNDHYCWTRPEDIDYPRPVYECHSCSDLAAEMAAALAAASIVFKDNKSYSQKLVHGAATLWKFSRNQRGRYSEGGSDASIFYNSTSYWDEFVWGGAWMYLATGNASYLQLSTHPKLAKHAGAFRGGPDYGVLSWDNKLTGAQMSYVVGFGKRYPKHVHHRGASIPKNGVKCSCKGGWKWRDTKRPNPNTIFGAMVAGPDRQDGFRDVRTNYNYTEPTLAGNAGLVAALVSLSGKSTGVDKNTMFSAVPPMSPTPPPPPAPWRP
ncbi:hypothetical protein B296_00054099 [Ensete ventricosum]|uniref:Endoglucanase n=1 Tax=Ensete ventricosum TaxID=4639 RepID=A0A426XU77_ENSVE|nr:hypothetical protein B296_00054099 [Ensete ventricosum]